MAKVITTELQHSGASGANITLDSSKNVTCENNLTVDGTTTLTGAVTLPAGTTSDTLSFRNKIINGAMQIHQRTGTSTATNGYTLDRWLSNSSNDGAWAITQSTTAPDGFGNSLKVDCTTADASLAAGQFAQINHRIEAQNLQDLAFGTSSAKTITLSFWVRSNKTGNFTVAIQQNDNSSKQVSSVYAINTADTWEKKTITYAGDTSGVINNDNGQGLQISWNLALGSTYTSGTARAAWTAYADADFGAGQAINIMDNTANEWLISGVQLEVGSTATDFEHRSFGDELARCQRYYWKSYNYSVAPGSTSDPGSIFGRNYNPDSTYSQNALNVQFPVLMRATPTTVSCYAPHSGTVAKVSAGASNPPDCATEKSFTTVHMLGDRGFSGIQTASIGSGDFFGAHFTVDAEL